MLDASIDPEEFDSYSYPMSHGRVVVARVEGSEVSYARADCPNEPLRWHTYPNHDVAVEMLRRARRRCVNQAHGEAIQEKLRRRRDHGVR